MQQPAWMRRGSSNSEACSPYQSLYYIISSRLNSARLSDGKGHVRPKSEGPDEHILYFLLHSDDKQKGFSFFLSFFQPTGLAGRL